MFQNPYIGTITVFAGNFAPQGWMFCHGQQLEISLYPAMYSIIGLTYGGDGASTFALPDLRRSVAVHAGQAPGMQQYYLGQQGGNETIVLTIGQVPAHTHPLAKFAVTVGAPANSQPGTTDIPTGNVPAQVASAPPSYSTALSSNTASGNTVITAPSLASISKNTALNIASPYVAMNYIICMDGVYPSHG